ncbi:MAG: hypothetical protein K2L26_00700, partial [Duncaniella sp.]|nr:hypothetical protein [Duncaniella sp.]
RPGDNHGHRPGGNRPGDNHGHRPGGNRPGDNHGHRPGGNRPGDNHGHRPGGPRPGNNWNHRPGNNWNHAHNNHRPGMMPPPYRPYRPVIVRPHTRPVPPPMWRPRPGLPVLRSVLGLTFGSALSVSLDFLIGNGYTVDGYTSDIVYLRNVPALNYIWTDGALYYGASGLDGSSFYYSTPGRDITRYNSCYNVLVNTYGTPVSVVRDGGGVVSTWFGGNNGYITLSFGAGQAGRFLTTLSYGL